MDMVEARAEPGVEESRLNLTEVREGAKKLLLGQNVLEPSLVYRYRKCNTEELTLSRSIRSVTKTVFEPKQYPFRAQTPDIHQEEDE